MFQFLLCQQQYWYFFLFTGKGKKDEDWSSEGSDVELKEASEDEIAKPVNKKKSKLFFVNMYLVLLKIYIYVHIFTY